MPKRQHFTALLRISWLLHPVPFLLCDVLCYLVGWVVKADENIPLRAEHSVSYSQHFKELCIFVLSAVHRKRKLLWSMCQDQAKSVSTNIMTIEQNSNSLYYPRTYLLAMGFSLGWYSSSHEISSCGKGLKCNQKADGYPTDVVNSATIFLAFIFNPVFSALIAVYTA